MAIRLPDINSRAFGLKVAGYITMNLRPPGDTSTEEACADIAARYAAAGAVMHSCLAALVDVGVDPDDIAKLTAKTQAASDACDRAFGRTS